TGISRATNATQKLRTRQIRIRTIPRTAPPRLPTLLQKLFSSLSVLAMAGDYPLRQMANPPPVSALRPAGTYVLPMSQPSDIVNRSEEVPAPLPGPVGHLSWHVCEL